MSRGPIHRHCPKIYFKTCHKVILWQKLRCHKMILQHILCQFTKFVLGDLKYSQDMTRCHSNNDIRLFPLRLCIMILAPVVSSLYPFLPVRFGACTSIRPSARHFHNTAFNVTSFSCLICINIQRWPNAGGNFLLHTSLLWACDD